jgi:hypothetical protein
MLSVDLLIITLFTNAAVELLRHDVRLQDLRVRWNTTGTRLTSRVLRCGFCSSFWAAALAVCLVGPKVAFPQHRVTLIPYLLAAIFAAARAAQLLNDWGHRFSRSPRRPEEQPDGSEDTSTRPDAR